MTIRSAGNIVLRGDADAVVWIKSVVTHVVPTAHPSRPSVVWPAGADARWPHDG